MSFTPFALETWQSDFEQTVKFNLADSGVHPLSLKELVDDDAAVQRLLDVHLHYPFVNGTVPLREKIAALYDRASIDEVLVTVGAAEANMAVVQSLVAPGDRVIVIEPGYRQVWGAMRNLGAEPVSFHLDPNNGWRPDLDAFDAMVTPGTRLIALTNPNNPTGTILTQTERERIIAAAARVGAWLLVDEVYRGTELWTDEETPSFWGGYDRLVVTNSLSKAYGLPGLRLGWILGPRTLIAEAWRRHEYATISTGMLSMVLGEIALTPGRREAILKRNRAYTRSGFKLIQNWVKQNQNLLHLVQPESTALAFVRYSLPVESLEMARLIKDRADVLVGAGDHFGVPNHLRITHGLKAEVVEEALERITAVFLSVR
jgi:aspartate/methionine/tyrosine aminotransferase